MDEFQEFPGISRVFRVLRESVVCRGFWGIPCESCKLSELFMIHGDFLGFMLFLSWFYGFIVYFPRFPSK